MSETFLVLHRRRSGWAMTEHETLEEAAREREKVLGVNPDAFIARRVTTRTVEVDPRTVDAIGGRELQEAIRDWMIEHPGTHHYMDIYEGLIAAGITVAGKDQKATLLTALSRTKGVQSVGPRTGKYKMLPLAGSTTVKEPA